MRMQINNNKDLGIFFREARKEKKLSIDEVAKQAGVSHTTLRNMEKSRGHVRTDVFVALANVIGMKLEVIITTPIKTAEFSNGQ